MTVYYSDWKTINHIDGDEEEFEEPVAMVNKVDLLVIRDYIYIYIIL